MNNTENTIPEILQYILKFCEPRVDIPLVCKTWAAAFAEVYKKKSALGIKIPIYKCRIKDDKIQNSLEIVEHIFINIFSYIRDPLSIGAGKSIDMNDKYATCAGDGIIDLSKYLYIQEIEIFVYNDNNYKEDPREYFINLPIYCKVMTIDSPRKMSYNLCTSSAKCTINRLYTDANISLQSRCDIRKEIYCRSFYKYRKESPPYSFPLAAFPNIECLNLIFRNECHIYKDHLKYVYINIDLYSMIKIECRNLKGIHLNIRSNFDAAILVENLMKVLETNPALCEMHLRGLSKEQCYIAAKLFIEILEKDYILIMKTHKYKPKYSKIITSLLPVKDILFIFGGIYLSKKAAERLGTLGGISSLKTEIDFIYDILNARTFLIDLANEGKIKGKKDKYSLPSIKNLSAVKLSYCGEEYEMRLDNIAAFNVSRMKKYFKYNGEKNRRPFAEYFH